MKLAVLLISLSTLASAAALADARPICEKLLSSGKLVAAYYEINAKGDDGESSVGDVVVIRDRGDRYEQGTPEMPASNPRDEGKPDTTPPLRPDLTRELELPLQEITPDKRKERDKLPLIMPMIVPLQDIWPAKKPTKPVLN